MEKIVNLRKTNIFKRDIHIFKGFVDKCKCLEIN